MKRANREVSPLVGGLVIIGAIGAAVAVYLVLARTRAGEEGASREPNQNHLAIGPLATVSGPIAISIGEPVELDGMTAAAVLELRTRAVEAHPDLVAGGYSPWRGVFGQIVGGAPWWGIQGQYFEGPGEKSTIGPAEESRFLGNPFLLVAADFLGLSIWGEHHLEWDRDRITGEDLRRPDFPFTCAPSELRWWPREARAEVSYDVSGYLARVNERTRKPLGLDQATFDLIAYNAADLGLGYLFLSYAQSDRVSKTPAPAEPLRIPHFIHLGGSCGYPGGCNNMSPDTAEIEGIRLEGLPAKASIHLWAKKPGPDGAWPRPDMTFIIRFK